MGVRERARLVQSEPPEVIEYVFFVFPELMVLFLKQKTIILRLSYVVEIKIAEFWTF